MYIPEGYEVNDDPDYKIKRDETYYSKGINGEYYREGNAQGYSGFPNKRLNQDGYFVFRIKIPDTPEYRRQNARKFVLTHISNPSEQTYKKFEEAFVNASGGK